uniref:Uncharacterized protein n=1 Tax=Sphaerodactylus townsendi TaxID=933632 RepID=A0ACB8FSK9_9SAUR
MHPKVSPHFFKEKPIPCHLCMQRSPNCTACNGTMWSPDGGASSPLQQAVALMPKGAHSSKSPASTPRCSLFCRPPTRLGSFYLLTQSESGKGQSHRPASWSRGQWSAQGLRQERKSGQALSQADKSTSHLLGRQTQKLQSQQRARLLGSEQEATATCGYKAKQTAAGDRKRRLGGRGGMEGQHSNVLLGILLPAGRPREAASKPAFSGARGSPGFTIQSCLSKAGSPGLLTVAPGVAPAGTW